MTMRSAAFFALAALIPASLGALAPRATNAGPCGVCPYSTSGGARPVIPPTFSNSGNTLVCAYQGSSNVCDYDLTTPTGARISGSASFCPATATPTTSLCPKQDQSGTGLTDAYQLGGTQIRCYYGQPQCKYLTSDGSAVTGNPSNCPTGADTCNGAGGARRRGISRDSAILKQRQVRRTARTRVLSL